MERPSPNAHAGPAIGTSGRPGSAPGAHVDAIQALRGVAALAVVLYHARQELAWRHIPVPLPDIPAGAAGVDLFFVVSGFVMVHASRPLFGEPRAIVTFLARRIARIVPLYWFFTFARVLHIAISNRHSVLLNDLPSHLFHSLSFIPAGIGTFPIVVQGWTLDFEMFFYLCFACCLPLRAGAGLLTLCGGLIGLALLGGFGVIDGPAAAICNPQLLEFVGGVLIGWLHARRIRIGLFAAALAAAAAVAALLATAPVLDSLAPWRGVVWGMPATAIVAGATLARGGARPAWPRPLLRLGDASYSLYLSHMLVFSMTAQLALRVAVANPLGALLYLGSSIGLALCAGFAVHRWIEVPITRVCGSLLRRHPAGTVRPGVLHPASPDRGAPEDFAAAAPSPLRQ